VTVSSPGGGDDHAPFARFRHGIFMDGGGGNPPPWPFIVKMRDG